MGSTSRLTAAAIALALASTACGSSSDSAEKATTTTTAELAPPAGDGASDTSERSELDVCKIVTLDLVEAVAGEPMALDETSTSDQCSYVSADPGEDFVSIVVSGYQVAVVGGAASFAATVSGQSDAFMGGETDVEELKKAKGGAATEVPGIGDAAFASGEPPDMLHVEFGDVLLSFAVNTFHGPDFDRAVALASAVSALL